MNEKPEVVVDVEPEVVMDPKAKAREAARLRKQAQRERDRAAKAVKEAAKQAKNLETASNEYWWTYNRSRDLSKAQQAEYAAREVETVELEIEVENFLFSKGKLSEKLQKYREEGLVEAQDLDLSAEQVADLVRRVTAHEEANGTRMSGLDFDFASTRDEHARWFAYDKMGTRIWILYGYLVALDSALYSAFHLLTIKRTRTCQMCKQEAPYRSPHKAEFYCEKCETKRAEEAQANHVKIIAERAAVAAPDNITPFDAWGRKVSS